MTTLEIKKITPQDRAYPRLLKEIHCPPKVLYYLGELKKEDELALAVVGTRNPTDYARQAVPFIIRELVGAGITIVSGLALGVDALAHKYALENNGRTIAVLGSGLNSIAPQTNAYLAKKIVASHNGAVVSEYEADTPALPHHFPARNRIISGLSLGTLVIEAAEKSGALITARFALEQNRDVFSLPGSIFREKSIGTNNLIKRGAKLTTSARDILEELNLEKRILESRARTILPESTEETLILKFLDSESVHIDMLIRKTGLPTKTLMATLTIMELKGKVQCLAGQNYVLGR